MNCPKCAYPNQTGVIVCLNCGNDLTRATVVASETYVKVIPQKEEEVKPNVQETIGVEENLDSNIQPSPEKTISDRAYFQSPPTIKEENSTGISNDDEEIKD